MATHTENPRAIVFDRLRELFRDDDCFMEFVNCFLAASQSDLAGVFFGQELIGTVLSPEATKDVLYDRMLKRAAEQPELLSELADRFKDPKIVD